MLKLCARNKLQHRLTMRPTASTAKASEARSKPALHLDHWVHLGQPQTSGLANAILTSSRVGRRRGRRAPGSGKLPPKRPLLPVAGWSEAYAEISKPMAATGIVVPSRATVAS